MLYQLVSREQKADNCSKLRMQRLSSSFSGTQYEDTGHSERTENCIIMIECFLVGALLYMDTEDISGSYQPNQLLHCF